MLLRHRIALPIAILSLAFLAACGGSSNKSTPPPTGGFSDSNLSGAYVFSFAGTDYSDSGSTGTTSFFAVTGELTANGSGGLSGTIDVVDPELGVALNTSYVQTGLSATGHYSITSDGRGSGSLSFTINGTKVTFGIDFVMTSSSHGLITRFDGNGTGSGTIDAQASGVAQSSLQGSYAFGLSGVDSSVSNLLGTVGSFTLDSGGNITSGLQDFNDAGNSTNLQALALTGSVDIGTAPGTAVLSTGVAGFPSLTFDVWVIDATHLKLIETDGVAYVAGDAYVSTGQSFPSGTLVYTMSGEDTSPGPVAMGGLLTSNGTSQITGGLEDVNDSGTVVQAPSINGGISTSAGRTVLSLNGIYNGDIVNNTLVTSTYSFAAYPFTYGGGGVGVVLLEIDNAGVTSGTAYLQSSTSVAASQGYGLNLSGVNTNGEVDMIAEFTSTSANLTGLYDVNNGGALLSDKYFGSSNNPGTYSSPSGGRGTGSVPLQTSGNNWVINQFNFTYYTVDSSTVAFIETDSTQLGTGTFQLQNASGTGGAAFALPKFSMVQPARSAAKKRAFKR